MKTVELLANVHLSPNFGLAKKKFKEGECHDAPKGAVEKVEDEVAEALVKRGLAKIVTPPPPKA